MLWWSLLFTKANCFLLLLYQSLWQIRIILLSLIFWVHSTLFNEVPCFGQAKLKHLIKSGIKYKKLQAVDTCFHPCLLSGYIRNTLFFNLFSAESTSVSEGYSVVWGTRQEKCWSENIWFRHIHLFLTIILRCWKSTHSVLIKIQFKLIVFGLCKYIFRNLCRSLFLV